MSGEFLKGFRALDLTGLSGQLCGRMLADLGMEVIKIEPPGGDPVRDLAPFITAASGAKLSTTFAHLNAGKHSKVIDLNGDAGRAAFRKLVESADVVIESFQPDELAARGLGYKDLAGVRNRRREPDPGGHGVRNGEGLQRCRRQTSQAEGLGNRDIRG